MFHVEHLNKKKTTKKACNKINKNHFQFIIMKARTKNTHTQSQHKLMKHETEKK